VLTAAAASINFSFTGDSCARDETFVTPLVRYAAHLTENHKIYMSPNNDLMTCTVQFSSVPLGDSILVSPFDTYPLDPPLPISNVCLAPGLPPPKSGPEK